MAASQTYNLKASLFEFGMSLQKHIVLQIGPLNINICFFSLLFILVNEEPLAFGLLVGQKKQF